MLQATSFSIYFNHILQRLKVGGTIPHEHSAIKSSSVPLTRMNTTFITQNNPNIVPQLMVV